MSDVSDDYALKRWEITGRTWDSLTLDSEGRLIRLGNEDRWESESGRRRLTLRHRTRGLIRSIVLVVDLSEAALLPLDFGQPRLRLVTEQLSSFLKDFFDQNPISQISIVGSYDNRGHILSPLCGSLDRHLDTVSRLSEYTTEGQASLQNSLALAASLLSSATRYSTKEILVIYGSLNTNDILPIDSVIKNLNSDAIVASVIGFGAGLYVLSRIAKETGGTYFVPLNAEHFQDLLRAHIEPPEWTENHQRLEMIPFGFVNRSQTGAAFDATEIKSDRKAMPKFGGSVCPRCGTKVFAVPVYCPGCSLLLLTPMNVSRCLIRLKGVAEFTHVDRSDRCEGCGCQSDEGMDVCEQCGHGVCRICRELIFEKLMQCPFCLTDER